MLFSSFTENSLDIFLLVFLTGTLKGDLDGTILSHAIFCSPRYLRQAKIVHNSHHITSSVAAIVVEFQKMF